MSGQWEQEDAERRFMWFTLWIETIRWIAQVATPILLAVLIFKLWL